MTAHRHPIVCIVNHSTVVTDAEVVAALPAFQRQVTHHFQPHWNAGATLLRVKDTPQGVVTSRGIEHIGRPVPETAKWIAESIPAGAWLIVIADDSDQAGALGYHEVDPRDTPIGYVFAKTDQRYGLSWTVTLSHELLEMLGDPLAVLQVQVKADGTALAYETADAVEADADGYRIDVRPASGDPYSVLVSNFVFPNWFVPGSPGPWDYRGQLDAPLELRPGGYIGVWRPGKGWTQETADVANPLGSAGRGLPEPGKPRHENGPRFRMRTEGRGRADHSRGDLPAWLEGGAL